MPKSSHQTMSKSSSNLISFYSVYRGYQTGIFTSWPETQKSVHGYPKAIYKKFKTKQQAEEFLKTGDYKIPTSNTPTLTSITTTNSNPSSSGSSSSALTCAFNTSNQLNFNHQDPVKSLDNFNTLRVYCDGACSNNGQKDKLTPAGSGVWWEPNEECPVKIPTNLACRLPGPLQSNNRAELYAIYLVLKHDPDPNLKLEIYTDSQYSINCITKWLSTWVSNGWKTSGGKVVENQDLIDAIRSLLLKRDQVHRNGAQLIYVKGHSGILGNVEADRLARLGTSKAPIDDLILD